MKQPSKKMSLLKLVAYCFLLKIIDPAFLKSKKSRFSLFERDHNGKIIFLPMITSIITIFAIGIAYYEYLASVKNLELSTDPQLAIYSTSPETTSDFLKSAFVMASNGLTNLVLRNDFPGSLAAVEVYHDYVTIIQDRNTYEVFVCDNWNHKIDKVVSKDILRSGNKTFFSINVTAENAEANEYIKRAKIYHLLVGVIRLKVFFQKEINHQSYVKDYYFVPYGSNGNINELIRYPDSDFLLGETFYKDQKHKEAISGEEIMRMLKEANFQRSDLRCRFGPDGKLFQSGVLN